MNNIYTVKHESLQHVKERKADEGEFFTIYLIINLKISLVYISSSSYFTNLLFISITQLYNDYHIKMFPF